MFTGSFSLDHFCWVMFAGPYLLGHIRWVMFAGSCVLGHVYWVMFVGSGLQGQFCWVGICKVSQNLRLKFDEQQKLGQNKWGQTGKSGLDLVWIFSKVRI